MLPATGWCISLRLYTPHTTHTCHSDAHTLSHGHSLTHTLSPFIPHPTPPIPSDGVRPLLLPPGPSLVLRDLGVPGTLVLLPFVARVAEALSVHQLSDHLAAGLHGASEVDLHLLDVHQHLGVHAAQAPHTPLHLGQIAPKEAAAQLQAVRRGVGGWGGRQERGQPRVSTSISALECILRRRPTLWSIWDRSPREKLPPSLRL